MLPPKLISPRVVTDRTTLSEREQRRKPGFPKPVKLGVGKSGRIAYVESEIDAWNAARVAERDADARPPEVGEAANDACADAAPVAKRPPGRPRVGAGGAPSAVVPLAARTAPDGV